MKKSSVSDFASFLGIFCMVFSFYLVSAVQVSFLVGCVCLCIICCDKAVCKTFSRLVCSDLGQIIFVGYFFILFLNLFFAIINGTFDVSYFNTLAMQLIKIVCAVFFVSCLHLGNKKIEFFENIFVYMCVVQSCIQFAAFANKSIAQVVLFFNHAYDLYEGYSGRRGLGLSGGTGWPLAIVYSVSFLFYTKNFILADRKLSVRDVLTGVLLLLGVLFSGRSAYLGILASILYFVFCHKKGKGRIVFRFCFFLIIASGLTFLFMVAFAGNMYDTFVNLVLPWAFEFFYKKAEKGTLSTGSTDVLMEMWTRVENVTARTMLLGDGFFTEPNTGRYYQHIDIGYLRNVFYWGFFGTSVLYVSYILLFIPKLLRNKLKNERLFIYVLIFSIFILELKAMTVFTAHLATVLIVIWLFIDERIFMRNRQIALELKGGES